MSGDGAFEARFARVLDAAAEDPAARQGIEAVRRAWRGHEAQLFGTADDVRKAAPDFFARLEAVVLPCRGVVLEIGCSLGQVTRWIAAEEAVRKVIAVDRDPVALAFLRRLELPKTEVLTSDKAAPERIERVDTLVLCEFIEHVTTRDELALLDRYARCFKPDARFVISTPIGFLPDPDHVRGFTKTQFIEHVEGLYGPIEAIDYRSGYSQAAVGRLVGPAKPYRG